MSRNAYALFPYGGGVDFDVRNWGGYRCRAAVMGGIQSLTAKSGGGATCGRRPRDSGHPPLSVFLAPSLRLSINIMLKYIA